jgi:hypothetical protein
VRACRGFAAISAAREKFSQDGAAPLPEIILSLK